MSSDRTAQDPEPEGRPAVRRTEAAAPAGFLKELRMRVGGAIALSIPLAFAGTTWEQFLHEREGGHEEHAPGSVLSHLLRDGTMALPLVMFAVICGWLLARRLVARAGPGLPAPLATALPPLLGAAAAALVFGVSTPIHAAMFGAHHGGPDMAWWLHILRDASMALPVCVALAAGFAGVPPAARALTRASGRLAPRGVPVAALRACLLLVLAAPTVLLVHGGVESATAEIGAGQPCPDGAPVKRFDVRAIDVDITLNRFGDHDPDGRMYVLAEEVRAVRAQEASRKVSLGLGDDAIQPLVIRANLGDCVEIEFGNDASGGEYGMHIDGVAFTAQSSGDAVGENPATGVPTGGRRSYRYYVPKDPQLEGTHYIRPGPGYREAVAHGLFGALSVEPAGSVYLHPDTGAPLKSGWEAMIRPEGAPAFREYVKLYHEVGDEKDMIVARDGHDVPVVDPITDSYRPGSRAINYRSEPFMNRLERAEDMKSLSYNSYTFGDPATPIMRAYSADPSKIRVMHAGSEMFHVYHMHGGGIRWPQNPDADKSFDYGRTGLDKKPRPMSTNRLDSQSFGPGESYTMEIEGGAGGVQRAVGDLLEHCHIAEHYVSGMWSMWRVFNTRQPDLRPLPDRTALPGAVDSSGLIGRTMPDGTTLTADNLADWVEEIIPPRGIPKSDTDGSVWNWSRDDSDPDKPVYLGEPEETEPWPNLPGVVPGHAAAQPGDTFVGDRPRMLFNPADGRPAYPLLRPNIGRRAPQTPNGHSGAPFLGATADRESTRPADPWAKREDGLCPSGSRVRRFNMTSIELPIEVTDKGGTDATGKIFVLSKDKAAVRSGDKPVEPLAIRANIGDCVALTLSTEFKPATPGAALPRSNVHPHHVQFDPQGSDGASAGMVFDQSVLPYQLVDPRLTAAADPGDTVLQLDSVEKFQAGVSIAIGEGTDEVEVRDIVAIDASASTLTLDSPLTASHAVGEWAGTEFLQLRWYPDVELDNVFWHDHVDGIHGWGKGLVGQLIVEPRGSTYHDPTTGEEVESGTLVDIRTSDPLAPGLVTGSFRELALWTIDDNPVTDSTLNLRAAPWSDRLEQDPDPSLLFSSWRHGDPNTPLPRAYRGDPFVLRTVNVSGSEMDSLRLAGHRFYTESRYRDADGRVSSTPRDSLQYGISERFTAILEGGAGGTAKRAGDYLYHNGIGRRFRQGAWGLLRVLGSRQADLQPLPGTSVADGAPMPQPTGGRPPVAQTAGDPCPSGAARRSFAISAVDLPGPDGERTRSAFVATADVADVRAGRKSPEPLVLHAAAGECVEVDFTNHRDEEPDGAGPRASFHVAKLAQAIQSAGVNAGYNPEQTVAPGDSRTYRFHADSAHIGSATIADFGGLDTGTRGLHGALVVGPEGARFKDPRTGLARDIGSQVTVEVPGGESYRDYTLAFSENDPRIGENTMPYPDAVEGPALVNYRSEPRGDGPMAFSSRAHGDPVTPLLRAYAGDRVKVHVLGAPGSEQPHAFSLGGLNWAVDPLIRGGNVTSAAALLPWTTLDAEILGGAGGHGRAAADYWYGDLRRPFAQAGMWGLLRVLPRDRCEDDLLALPGRACGEPEAAEPAATPPPRPESTPEPAPTPTTTAPSPPAAAPAPPSAQAKAARVRSVRAPRRIAVGDLRRRGLHLGVDVTPGVRMIRVALHGRGRASKPLHVRWIRTHAGRTVRTTYRLPARIARRMRPGHYELRVQGGPQRARLGRTVVRAVHIRARG